MQNRTHGNQPEAAENEAESEFLALEPLLLAQHKRMAFHSKPQSQPQPIGGIFPHEIMVDILTRLPVKCLMRSRSVSKSWLSLMSDPNFIKSHLKKCSENKENEHHRLILVTDERHKGKGVGLKKFECSLHTAFSWALSKKNEVLLVTDNFMVNRDIHYDDRIRFKIVGSFYGLVLITIDPENLFLWNPATRKYRKLPNCGWKRKHLAFDHQDLSFGIGYDESNDDYMILGLSRFDYSGQEYETLAKVYSGKTGSWRKIKNFKYSVIDAFSPGCYFLNGKFHFTVGGFLSPWADRLSYEQEIASLDLADDIYGQIELPEYENICDGWTLGTLGGCLSLLLRCIGPQEQVELWVMKEYGMRGSWTKLVVIPAHCWCDFIFRRPLLLSKDGQLLFMTWPSTGLVVYDPNQNSQHIPNFSNWNCLYGGDIFIESLISP